ncbi:MAG TPA: hypothetical protein VMM18_03380 [Gemmatimonadaceae bacterium]|nr:hypothetical protein [Gemmatimonadaceae bacterium]
MRVHHRLYLSALLAIGAVSTVDVQQRVASEAPSPEAQSTASGSDSTPTGHPGV